MEGTRNERATIVLVAYIIGFTTAFIAFGLTQLEESVKFVYVQPTSQAAAVVSATEVASPFITLTESGLVYKNGEKSQLISVYDVTESGKDGFHQSIFESQLSADGVLVYFCEIPTMSATACKPFVYNSVENMTYPITVRGERIALPLTPATLVWELGQLTQVDELLIDPVPNH